MRNVYLTFVILLAGHSVYAQTNRLSETGNVGIGTVNPAVPLHIVKSPAAQTDVPMQEWDPAVPGYNLTLSNFNSDNGIDYRFIQYTNGNPTPVLTFRAGNVGIGTTNPTVPFHIVKSPAVHTNIPMQEWDPAILGYNLTLSNFNSDNGIDYRFTQYTNGNASPVLTFRAGNVGIGTTSPTVPLHIVKSPAVHTNIPMQEWDPAVPGYNLTLSNFNSDNGIDYIFTQYTNGNAAPVLTFQGGNVGIGTATPDSKLAVNGVIHSQGVIIDLKNWPDYVFKPKYNLPSIYEVRSYINENHHLPEMPSEQEVANKGIDIGEMNKLLVKKVEELTLYLIQQKEESDKRNQIQQEEINQMKNQLTRLIKSSQSK